MIKFNLLPNYFKKVGIIIVLLSFILIVLKKMLNYNDYLGVPAKILFFSMLIGGLTIFALSKDRIEDEMNMQRRARSMSGAFVFGVVILIVNPLISLLFGDEPSEMPSHQLILTMVGFYLITFNLDKKINNVKK